MIPRAAQRSRAAAIWASAAGQHHLLRRITISDGQVESRVRDEGLDRRLVDLQRQHGAPVAASHEAAAQACQCVQVRLNEATGAAQRRQFAEAVSRDRGWQDPEVRQEHADSIADRAERRLRHGGITKHEFVGFPLRIVEGRVRIDPIAQPRFPIRGIGRGERSAQLRELASEVARHPDVL